MLATFIIVFREVLEAGLIVGIVLAATAGTPLRGLWVVGGIALGIAGSVLVAAFAGVIVDALSGMGQEVFNAAVLFLAVIMLGWHNIWMQRHGRRLTADMKTVGRAIASGARPRAALTIVVGLAVLREGAEVVLFLSGIAFDAEATRPAMLTGAFLGIMAAAAISYGIYAGMLTLSQKRLFSVTTWLITLLAAGMAAQGAGYLVAAGLVPSLGDELWDTSSILSDRSVPGIILRTLIGYMDRPSGLQVLIWIATVSGIVALTSVVRGSLPRPSQPN